MQRPDEARPETDRERADQSDEESHCVADHLVVVLLIVHDHHSHQPAHSRLADTHHRLHLLMFRVLSLAIDVGTLDFTAELESSPKSAKDICVIFARGHYSPSRQSCP